MNRRIWLDEFPEYTTPDHIRDYHKHCFQEFWYLNYNNGMNYYIRVFEQ